METARIAQHSLRRLPSNTNDRLPSSKFHMGIGHFTVSEGPKNFVLRSSVRFSDSGHLQYYISSRKETKKKEKEKSSEIKSVTKKLKFIKKLSSELSLFSLETSNSGEESGISLVDEEKISEVVKLLQAQLQQLKLEQMELKRTMKEQKARTKPSTKSKCKSNSSSGSSSSSSSESSDSDQGKVIDMIRLRSNLLRQSEKSESQKEIKEATLAKPSLVNQQENSEEELRIGELTLNTQKDCCLRIDGQCSSCNSCSKDQSNSRIVEERSTKRIEICMGGKCKKSGAVALLEEFERKADGERDVSVCKCMGKCKNAPNIRVSEIPNGDQATIIQGQGYAKTSINSICIGVGLEDVDMILANILGRDRNNNALMASS